MPSFRIPNLIKHSNLDELLQDENKVADDMFSKKTLFLPSNANNSHLWDNSQELSTVPWQSREQKSKAGFLAVP